MADHPARQTKPPPAFSFLCLRAAQPHHSHNNNSAERVYRHFSHCTTLAARSRHPPRPAQPNPSGSSIIRRETQDYSHHFQSGRHVRHCHTGAHPPLNAFAPKLTLSQYEVFWEGKPPLLPIQRQEASLLHYCHYHLDNPAGASPNGSRRTASKSSRRNAISRPLPLCRLTFQAKSYLSSAGVQVPQEALQIHQVESAYNFY